MTQVETDASRSCADSGEHSSEGEDSALDPPVPRARAREEMGLAVPSRLSDERVLQVVELMVGHSWTSDRAVQLAAEWRLHPDTIARYAMEAARFIRLCQDPQKVREWGMVKLNRLVEDNTFDEDGRPLVPAPAKVAAIKVALDATMPRDPAKYGAPQVPAQNLTREERIAQLRSALESPDEELTEAMRLAGVVAAKGGG